VLREFVSASVLTTGILTCSSTVTVLVVLVFDFAAEFLLVPPQLPAKEILEVNLRTHSFAKVVGEVFRVWRLYIIYM
jgi:hypothetical protein